MRWVAAAASSDPAAARDPAPTHATAVAQRGPSRRRASVTSEPASSPRTAATANSGTVAPAYHRGFLALRRSLFLVSWPRMRQATPRSPLLRIVAGLLLAALCAPAPVWAADEESATAKGSEESGTAEGSETPLPAPIEKHWYDAVLHNIDVTAD